MHTLVNLLFHSLLLLLLLRTFTAIRFTPWLSKQGHQHDLRDWTEQGREWDAGGKTGTGISWAKSFIYRSKTYSEDVSVRHVVTTWLVIFSNWKNFNRRDWEKFPNQFMAFYFWQVKHCLGREHSSRLLRPWWILLSLRYQIRQGISYHAKMFL